MQYTHFGRKGQEKKVTGTIFQAACKGKVTNEEGGRRGKNINHGGTRRYTEGRRKREDPSQRTRRRGGKKPSGARR